MALGKHWKPQCAPRVQMGPFESSIQNTENISQYYLLGGGGGGGNIYFFTIEQRFLQNL